jgi:hypothetical protein
MVVPPPLLELELPELELELEPELDPPLLGEMLLLDAPPLVEPKPPLEVPPGGWQILFVARLVATHCSVGGQSVSAMQL